MVFQLKLSRMRRGGGIRGSGARGGGGRSSDTVARDRTGGQEGDEGEVEEEGSTEGGGVKDELLRERAAVVWVWASGERRSADVRRGRP